MKADMNWSQTRDLLVITMTYLIKSKQNLEEKVSFFSYHLFNFYDSCGHIFNRLV